MSTRAKTIWTFIVTSVAVFMVSLDNLVVTTALPVIKQDLGASLQGLEWTVNAYTLTFAVLLLTGAALGDRFGRKRMFGIGLAVFTLGSALAALAPTIGTLIGARALQGVGGAIVTPLTLTILSAAVPPARRGLALGIWGGVSGLAVAIGPVVGGAVVEGLSWQWIFWLNVPIGIALLPIAWLRLTESKGPNRSLDLPGLALASTGLLGIVWGLIRGNEHGWTSLGVAGPIVAGVVLLTAFVLWELRSRAPMVPMRFFRSRAFSAANAHVAAHELRHVRRDLPARPVLPGRAGLLAARGRRPDAALDGDADPGGADRRHPQRPYRQSTADRRRHGADGRRHGVDRRDRDADRAVRRARAGVRHGRDRHVALLRPSPVWCCRRCGAAKRARPRA